MICTEEVLVLKQIGCDTRVSDPSTRCCMHGGEAMVVVTAKVMMMEVAVVVVMAGCKGGGVGVKWVLWYCGGRVVLRR
jgi:hypothetical protein